MAKNKKTRQQKIIADLRRQIYASQTKNALPEQKIEKEKKEEYKSTNLPQIQIAERHTLTTFVNTYPYLRKDLQKTVVLTSAIIAVQFILLFILKSHILVLNGLIY